MMPGRFDSVIYEPQTSTIMKSALDSAWTQVQPDLREAELIGLILAGPIADLIDAGIADHELLREGALKALDAAKKVTHSVSRNHPDQLTTRGSRRGNVAAIVGALRA
jgi:hypothetical protein